MGNFIQPDDLAPFTTIDPAKAQAMVDDAEATAILAAPCLADLEWEDPKRGAVKALLRRAILRWDAAGTGAVQQSMAGPFSQMIASGSNAPKNLFWPSEIEQLQGLCSTGDKGKAFDVDTTNTSAAGHTPWCSLMFGGEYCSCGLSVIGAPIYESA